MSHRLHPLDPLFRPKSVAVIGASATPGSVGSILMRNLTENGFGGTVYPVNPHRKSVHGIHCYASLADVPEPPELVVIATPAATVPALLQQFVERVVKVAVIISAGFSETGEQGRTLERRIAEIGKGKLRIVGPNCLGIIHPKYGLNASFAAATPAQGSIALLSQSGAICTAVLDWAQDANIGFRAVVSVGSMIDVDFADLIDYFGEDPATRSILLYMESVGDVRKFLSAARAVARAKPIIVVKSGRHEASAKAAASHTGALAGADAVFDAAFRRAGVLRVATLSELFNMAEILARQPIPAGPALAIITNAGGPGVMATDSLMLGGGQLAKLSEGTVAALNNVLPAYWSHANPIDVLGDAPPERYAKALEICAADPGVDGLLVLLTPQAMTDPTATAQQLLAQAHKFRKPVLTSWMGGAAVRPARRIQNMGSIPTFDSPEEAVQAFLHMVQYKRNQELLYETPETIPEQDGYNTARVRELFVGARATGRRLLMESEAKEILAAYRIPTIATMECRTVDEAVVAAEQLGFPVVVKLLSKMITHKTDVGGVQLDLRDKGAVRDAYQAIQAKLTELAKPDAFDGVTVQPMVRAKGIELILGSSIDRQFGPVILFGAGGVLVEVIQDRALALPPLNRTLARRLMERTRIYQALQGVRGTPAVDIAQLETLLVRFSQLITDFSEIAELDINPLLAGPAGIFALDARIVLSTHDKPCRLAIMPYPNQYAGSINLADGRTLLVRPIRAEDESLIVKFHAEHSEETLRMRFFGLVRVLSRESLIRLCHLDYDREMALIALWQTQDETMLAGVSRYYLRPETGEAEFAVVVGDAWHRRGLGLQLMQRLISIARERGVRRFVGEVLAANGPMLRLMAKLNFRVEGTPDPQVVQATLEL